MKNLLTLLIGVLSLAIYGQNSDCTDAINLCGDTVFTFESGIDAGQVDELSADDNLCVRTESTSNWLEWTMAEAGTLTFVLSTIDNFTDLDFVLYRVTGQICEDLEAVRCMASGVSTGQDSEPCMGPTGLALGETDVSENPGCDNGSNNFLAPLETQAGERYVLLVMNFTQTGNVDISLEFEGARIEDCGSGSTSVEDATTTTSLFSISQSATHLDINVHNQSSEASILTVYNITGQVVSSCTIADNHYTLDLAGIPTGQYLTRLTQGKNTDTKRFIIAK